MGNTRKEKKARILAQQKRKQTIRMAVTGFIAVAIVTVGVVFFVRGTQQKTSPATAFIDTPSFGQSGTSSTNRTQSSGRQGYTNVTADDGMVTFNSSDFSDGKAAYFETSTAGKTIRYFVLQSADGVIRAAFDACDVCFPAKKGYRQDGDHMVCNNCGQRFHSARINVEKGGCNPSPLERHEQNGVLTIALNDIAKGAMYF